MGVSETMALFWITLIISVIGSHAERGELRILSSPDGLEFAGSQELPLSILKEVYTASLGMTVEPQSRWSGLYIRDPFKVPEAVVQVHVDGVSSLGDELRDVARYPVQLDVLPLPSEFLKYRMRQCLPGEDFSNCNFVQSTLSDVEKLKPVFGSLENDKIQELLNKKSADVYDQFLTELEVLRSIITAVENGKVNRDIKFYFFQFPSLHVVSDHYGAKSRQTKEAKTLLIQTLKDLYEAFNQAYSRDMVLTTVLTTDYVVGNNSEKSVRRVIRAADDAKDDKKFQTDNYSADYSAIFNIILWFGVVFAFALISIVYAIMDMDPGRDSIIYRMTNTRMKKDN